jgi:hypothetical protein
LITHSGRSVFVGSTAGPSLDDIAVGLGRTARFAGQTKRWYPVLAHTIVVSKLVRPENRLHALLHDAPESVVGDVPTTWKTDAARDHEDALLCRIYTELGIAMPGPEAIADVALADHLCLVAEAHVLGHAQPTWWDEEPNVDAVRWTKGELRFCRQYLTSARAQTVYGWHVKAAMLNLRRDAA